MGLAGTKPIYPPSLIKKPAPRLPCKIILASGLGDPHEKKIRALSPEITLLRDLNDTAYKEALSQADVYFGRVPAKDFALAKNLSWVQSSSAGVEKQLYPDFKVSEVVLTNAKGCYAPAIAEHVIGLVFSLTRERSEPRSGTCKNTSGVDPVNRSK